jgi:DNA polymerase-3 subunit gamma/tau
MKTSEDPTQVLDMSEENLARLKEEAGRCSLEQIMRYIRIFSELSGQLRFSSQKRVLTEMAIVKLCKPQMERSYEALLERMLLIEAKIEQGIALEHPKKAKEETGPFQVKQELPKALPEDIRQIAANWRGIVEDASGLLQPCLRRARISLGDKNQLLLVFEDEFAYERAGRSDSLAELKELIARRFQRETELELVLSDSQRRFEDAYIDLEKLILADIEIEEE